MAKFYGKVGFVKTEETTPGVYTEVTTEQTYYGDVQKDRRSYQTSEKTNDDLTISNEISILADTYAIENFQWMKYVEYLGALWKITNIEIKYPRLALTIGGVYNGEQA